MQPIQLLYRIFLFYMPEHCDVARHVISAYPANSLSRTLPLSLSHSFRLAVLILYIIYAQEI